MASSATDRTVHRFSGFVDLQVNGGFGHDFTTRPDSIWEVAARLPEHGVTAFVPTLVSSGPDVAFEAFRVLASGPPSGWIGARPLGIHLEGPFLAPGRRGTHETHRLTRPDLDLVERWIGAGPPMMVTIAPEVEGATAVIRRLGAGDTVVALGHSDCTAAEADHAFDLGASHVTHLFNAMSGLDHRHPGLAAASLAHPTATVGLIADGVHVHPTMLRLTYRLLGRERIALVTDAVAALGMGDGEFNLGDTPVTVIDGVVRNSAGGLAGSAASMPDVARTMLDATDATATDVLTMASTTPARIAGFSPPPGDAVELDEDFEVVSTRIDGQVVFRRQG